MPEQPTYTKLEREIADMLFACPDKKMSEVVSYFVGKCRKSARTVERYIQKAQQYNRTRLNKQEKARDEVLVDSAKEAVKRDIMTREEAEEQLTGIARGKAVKIGDQLLVATYSERIKAMAQLGKMRGWETPIKTETTLYGTAINIQVVDSKLPLVSNEQEVG